MRINGKHQAIAMAALLLASCSQKEVLPVDSTPEGEYRYTLQIDAATRAVYDNDHMAWQEGDRIGWFSDRDGSSEVNMDTTPRSFSVSSTAALGAGACIYAYAPFQAGSQDKTAVALSIPLEQDGDAVRDAMPLVAIPVTVETPVEAGTDTPVGTALFCNLGAMIRYNVYTSDPYFAGEKVESVSFTATTALAGDFTYDITRVSLDQVPAIGGLTGTSVRSSLSTPAEVGGSRETGVKVCQVLAPGTYSGTFTVFTDKAAYSFSVTDASFERSRLRPVSLDLSVAGAERVPTHGAPLGAEKRAGRRRRRHHLRRQQSDPAQRLLAGIRLHGQRRNDLRPHLGGRTDRPRNLRRRQFDELVHLERRRKGIPGGG